MHVLPLPLSPTPSITRIPKIVFRIRRTLRYIIIALRARRYPPTPRARARRVACFAQMLQCAFIGKPVMKQVRTKLIYTIRVCSLAATSLLTAIRDTWLSRTPLRDNGALTGAWPSPRHVCRCRPGPAGSPLEGEPRAHQHTRPQSAPADVSLHVTKAKVWAFGRAVESLGQGQRLGHVPS